MAIENINLRSQIFYSFPSQDEEEKRIAAKLLEYGIIPTGNRTIDKSTLRQIELKEAQASSCSSNKFLTVSLSEQEKIQENKRENLESNNFVNKSSDPETFCGAKAKGEQIFLAIKLQKRKRLY